MGLQLGTALIGAFQMIVVAVIGGIFARDSKKRKKQLDNAEARAVLRAQESLLSMKLVYTSLNLSQETAVAVKKGKSNGELEAAIAGADEAKREYYDFINRIAVKQITE